MKGRKRFWSMIGSLAVMTGRVYAGEPSPSNPHSGSTNPRPSSVNQQTANEIASAIAREVPDRGYSVTLDCRNGVVTLRGTASSPSQLYRIQRVARSCPSVKRVVNEMKVVGDSSVQPAGYVADAAGQDVLIPAPVPVPAPAGIEAQVQAAAPEYTFPQGAAPQYDAPFLPPFAWPANAPYPNYSAVQYPLQYPATSWPYIGPFHPYPEPPLDWRHVKAYSLSAMSPIRGENTPPPELSVVKLRWDDGHWYMDFCHTWWGWLSGVGHAEPLHPAPCTTCMPGGYRVRFRHKLCTHMFMD